MDLMETLIALEEDTHRHDGTSPRIRRNGRWLSGIPYLWSAFGERAYVFPSVAVAQHLIDHFPVQLAGATVHPRQP